VLIGLVGVPLLALGLLAMSALNDPGEWEKPPALYVIAFGGLLSGAACLIGAMLVIFGES
jgi:hypothetical protein